MTIDQAQMHGLEPLLGVEELAGYLGVPVQTIYDWRVHGKGPRAYRVGKRIRFAVCDVRTWLEAQSDPCPGDAAATRG